MKVKKILVWSAVKWEEHPQLTAKERTIEGMMPLIQALFPGINYYSITGYGQVMRELVLPILKKRFPKLESTPAEKISRKAKVELTEVLPSKGYEWQDSEEWKSKFGKLLAAA